MKNKTGFILYFDILGYKTIINTAEPEDDKRMQYILDVYSTTQGKLNFSFVFNDEYIANKKKLLMRCFSDNFLFLYESKSFNECNTETTKKNYYVTLSNMISIASMIQSQFLQQGILTRGSLTFGKIYFNPQIVYGKSLVHAVDLEDGKAHPEPSIIMDEELAEISRIRGLSRDSTINPFWCHANSSLDHKGFIIGIERYLEKLNFDGCPKEDRGHVLEKIKWIIDRMNNYFEYENMNKYYLNETLKLEKKID